MTNQIEIPNELFQRFSLLGRLHNHTSFVNLLLDVFDESHNVIQDNKILIEENKLLKEEIKKLKTKKRRAKNVK